VQEQNDFRTVAPKRLLQLSAAGEVFLEGTCPLSRCPQTAKLPAPCFWRTEKVGEKSDSFSRAERTRPLRPVCRLLLCDFGNVPVERFQRDFPLPKSTDTARRVPTEGAAKLQAVFCAAGDYVCNVPPGHCKNQTFPLRFHTGSGLVRSPQKAAAFCPFLRVPRSMGTGISPSADGDLEGTCPLRTPRQLCSVGSA